MYLFKKYLKHLLPFPVSLKYAKALRHNKYLIAQIFVQIKKKTFSEANKKEDTSGRKRTCGRLKIKIFYSTSCWRSNSSGFWSCFGVFFSLLSLDCEDQGTISGNTPSKTQHHIPDDFNYQQIRCENIKSRIFLLLPVSWITSSDLLVVIIIIIFMVYSHRTRSIRFRLVAVVSASPRPVCST